jgi:hypothetical protein
MPSQYPNARDIAAKGSEIYDRKYRAQFERHHNGQFAAIDINKELAYLAELPEQALSKSQSCFG